MIEVSSDTNVNFDVLAKELLGAYKSHLAQGIDPFDTFKRLNDTYRLCCHNKNTQGFFQSFHEVLKSRISSSIRSGQSIDDHKENASTDDAIFFSKSESSNLAELILNIIQVEREAKRRNYSLDYSYLIDFDERIRKNSGWIENSYLEKTNELSNTFFLPTIYEEITSRADYFKNNTRNSEFSTNIFEEIFLELEKGPYSKKNGSVAANHVKALNRHSPDLFDHIHFKALAAIHHEISENALSHAVSSKINHHFNAATNKLDFGSIAYLKIQIFGFSRSIDKTKAFHPDFYDYHKKIVSGLYNFPFRKERRYMSITYADTGLGIQDHLKKFSGTVSQEWNEKTIDEVIALESTTRKFSGSGFGLWKTKIFTKQLRGFLSIDTPQSTYSFNGITGRSAEEAGRTSRGTMISIVIPA